MSNRASSVGTGREKSSFEAKIGSIKRRLTNPLPRRPNRLERRAFRATLGAQSNTMPKRNGKRGDYSEDWEASGDEASYVNVNGVGGNNAGNHDASRDEERDSNNYTVNSSSGKSHQKKEGSASQQKRKQDLGPWANALNDSIQKMSATQKALKQLQDTYTSHKEELDQVESTRRALVQLREECDEKVAEIQRQAVTIATLSKMNRQVEEEVMEQKEKNERERNDLEKEKIKNEKRIKTTIEVEKGKLHAELKELIENHAQSYEEKKRNLENELNEKRDQMDKEVEMLQSDNRQLSAVVEEQKEKILAQTDKLDKTIEQCDILNRAKDSFKREMQDREKQLDLMKREFSLKHVSKEEFKRRFAEMYKMIENISSEFSYGIDGKSPRELELASKALGEADSCFESVPIENSDDSFKLRSAHAQRIISDSIYQYIWRPFCSNFTLSHPNFHIVLTQMSDELERNGHSGRALTAWTALTATALRRLPDELSVSHDPVLSTGHAPQAIFRRTNVVISKVFDILSPMINSSQNEKLRIDLAELASRAIDLWDDAQTGELNIMVIPSLDRALHEEWRSQTFEPSYEFDGAMSNNQSKTHPRIFTLFPRIMAREVADPIEHDIAPPGSWHADSTEAPRIIETCIHPGVGLLESSPLVLRGKAAQDEKKDLISKALESATEAVHIQRRNTGHTRKESTGGPLTSPSSSPSQQWKTGGFMKTTDN